LKHGGQGEEEGRRGGLAGEMAWMPRGTARHEIWGGSRGVRRGEVGRTKEEVRGVGEARKGGRSLGGGGRTGGVKVETTKRRTAGGGKNGKRRKLTDRGRPDHASGGKTECI
jgi:hypothetical protein